MASWIGIEEFVAVAATGSFVGAARLLRLSTSQVSRAIRQLEGRLDAPVLLRTTRKVTLTDTGRALLEPLRKLVNERDEALAAASGGNNPKGDLRMTCSIGLGERFIAPILRRYAEDHPQVNVVLDLTNRIVDLVAEGYDIAIRTGNLTDSSLMGTRIASRRLVLCAAPAYLARRGRPQSLNDLAQHDCLVGTADAWQFDVEGEKRSIYPRPRWSCNSGDAIASAAIAGMGLCQLPEFYVADAIADGRLLTLLDDIRRADEPVWAVYPQRRHLLPKVQLLIERLKAELGPALARP